MDTRGSRSPFPLTSEEEAEVHNEETGFGKRLSSVERKYSPVLVPRLWPFWTLLPLRPKDVDSSGILDEEPEHRDRNQQQEQESAGVSLAKFYFSY